MDNKFSETETALICAAMKYAGLTATQLAKEGQFRQSSRYYSIPRSIYEPYILAKFARKADPVDQGRVLVTPAFWKYIKGKEYQKAFHTKLEQLRKEREEKEESGIFFT